MQIDSILSKLQIPSLNTMQNSAYNASDNYQDLVLLSPTGSGKTLAFLFPILRNLKTDKKGVQALIMAPSRELAIQIEQVFKSMGTGFKVNSCYGGHSVKIEENNFKELYFDILLQFDSMIVKKLFLFLINNKSIKYDL